MKKVALTLAIAFASYFTVNAQSNTTTSGTSNSNTEQQSTDVQSNDQSSQGNQSSQSTSGMGSATGSDVELKGEAASQLEELPAVVKSSFLSSEYADMEITGVEQEEGVFTIKGRKEEKEIKLEYDAQGRLVEKKKDE